MFGLGGRANHLSEGREGFTKIERPSSGKSTDFGNLRSGDFFTYKGTLFFKINLVEAVEVPDGTTSTSGTSEFSHACPVHAEHVTISIK